MLYYFKAKDGNEYGPISEEEIKDWKDQGRMNNESLVRAENSDEWVPLGKMSKLGSAPSPQPTLRYCACSAFGFNYSTYL